MAGGSLDGSFGTGGIVTTAVGSADALAAGVVVQADGRLVVAGTSLPLGAPQELASSAGESVLVARYDSDGALDPTFGDGGVVATRVRAGVPHDTRTVALQSDGKILVAGGLADKLFMARYDTEGDLDETFGSSGIVSSNHHGPAVGLELTEEGRIVVAGEKYMARYDESGTLDLEFGIDGTVEQPETVSLFGLDIGGDGTIFAGGTTSLMLCAVARYDRDGAIDTGFGAWSPLVDRFLPGYAMVTDTGFLGSLAATFGIAQDGHGVFARVGHEGRLGASWVFAGADVDGIPTFRVWEGGAVGVAPHTALAFQADGAVLTVRCGFRGHLFDDSRMFSLARFDAAGSPDPGFGVDGFVFVRPGESACARAVAVTADARIVAVGSAIIDGRRQLALARYHQ